VNDRGRAFSNDGEGIPIAQKQQAEALRRATEAAIVGDPRGMVEALYQSGAFDGLTRRIGHKWNFLSTHKEVDYIIGQAVDVLYRDVSSGKKISNIVAFLYKVANNKANDYWQIWQREHETPLDLEYPSYTLLDSLAEEQERDRKKERAISIARSLLPQLGQQNLRAVMSYLLEAVAMGYEDVSNEEIAEALGLSLDTVRQSLSRGFQRLERKAKEAGLTDQNFDFISARGEIDEDLTKGVIDNED